MFAAAAKALDKQVSEEDFMLGRILSLLVAHSRGVGQYHDGSRKGCIREGTPMTEPLDLLGLIKSKMPDPTYKEYV